VNAPSHDGTALAAAASAQLVKVVMHLLNAGADPNAGDPKDSPLMKVAFNGNVEIAKLLLDAGADATRGELLAAASHPRVCGCGCCRTGSNPSREMVLLLLRAGAPLPAEREPWYARQRYDYRVADILRDPAEFINADA
jgi:hypothetical protein